MAEKAGNATSTGNNRTHSNKGSREDEHGNNTLLTKGRDCSEKPLYNGGR